MAKKFELINPFAYKTDIIKEILVRQLCMETGYKRDASIYRIEHSGNLFREHFKKTESIREICDAIYNILLVKPMVYELAKCKSINDIASLLAHLDEEKKKNEKEALRLVQKMIANTYYNNTYYSRQSPSYWICPGYNYLK